MDAPRARFTPPLLFFATNNEIAYQPRNSSGATANRAFFFFFSSEIFFSPPQISRSEDPIAGGFVVSRAGVRKNAVLFDLRRSFSRIPHP